MDWGGFQGCWLRLHHLRQQLEFGGWGGHAEATHAPLEAKCVAVNSLTKIH
jgi:hypothetical protein